MNALDKKARRATRNKIRRACSDPMGLLKIVKYTIGEKVMVSDKLTMHHRLAAAKFGKLNALNGLIDVGSIAAAKERRSMFKPAYKEVEGNANGYFKVDQTFRSLELNVKRRYLV